MGKLNLKLMQGIEDAEGQIIRDKAQELHANEQEGQKEEIANEGESDNDSEYNQQSIADRIRPEHDRSLNKGKSNASSRKQVFSFRALLHDIDVWKAFATATGKTMENVGAAAMNAYIENYKLSKMEEDIFVALRNRNEDSKE